MHLLQYLFVLLRDHSLCLSVELLSLLLEHLVTNAFVFPDGFLIKLPTATGALVKVQIADFSEGVWTEISASASTSVFNGWDDLPRDLIIVVDIGGLRWLIGVLLLLLSRVSRRGSLRWSPS